jgi:hypothetical protein
MTLPISRTKSGESNGLGRHTKWELTKNLSVIIVVAVILSQNYYPFATAASKQPAIFNDCQSLEPRLKV